LLYCFRDDEKFGHRESYSGPTSDFKEEEEEEEEEEEGYSPDVKLDCTDDDGRVLNAKEAFRLAHLTAYLFLR
jgi:hypothetical protein